MQNELNLLPPEEAMTLLPGQSLALRRLVDLMKTDEAIYTACPDAVRSALAEIFLPPHTSAESHVKALTEAHEAAVHRLEQFGRRIHELQQQLGQRRAAQ